MKAMSQYLHEHPKLSTYNFYDSAREDNIIAKSIK